MNIAFFLVPKDEVIYFSPHNTMRQALERMEYHRYSAVPLVDDNGKYAGTITEGDLLWKLKHSPDIGFDHCHKVQLKDVPQHMTIKPVRIDQQMQDLITLATNQNFVPVTDDNDVFIGIIRRREIIDYCFKLWQSEQKV
ncbi:CBS domain-containing protein [Paenibacillus filicis]|uniref:CBS domain-containing protein n=1 Tax=Paenibacillus gyeongsangnamensis TaxID=3388067 RepID=A0ABT4QKN2_9BACL|nr:CBS domain-containing protein [Paenibacillus filicis]MCZ8517423.1 CBS domain-containing protein [Paenibacillus filicis]